MSKSGSGSASSRGMTNRSDNANSTGVAGHRDRGDQRRHRGAAGCQRAHRDRGAEQHEAELAGLWQGEAEPHRVAAASAETPAPGQSRRRSSPAAARRWHPPAVRDARRPDRRSADMPTEMKKKPSNSPSNGAMSASSSCRYSDSDSSTPAMNAPSDMRKSGEGGDVGGAGDDQQRRGREQLRRASAPKDADQRRNHEAPADQDDRDRGRAPRHVMPGQAVGQCVFRQQRHQRDQRNERQVLKQQHREADRAPLGFSAGRAPPASAARSRWRTSPGPRPARRAGPRNAGPVRQRGQHRAADHDLRRPKARTPRAASPKAAAAAVPARSGTAASRRRARRCRRSGRRR